VSKENKPFTMIKKEGKNTPPKKEKKEILDLSDLLVDKSNKTMILDLNELEFDEEKTEDISSRFKENPKNASELIIEDRPELELEDLLEEETIDNFSNYRNTNNEKTIVISIEDIIETPPIKDNESLIEDDGIFQEAFNSIKTTTSNTFIKNIDKKILDNLASSETPKYEYNVEQDDENEITIERSSEQLLDFLIYGKLDQFEDSLNILQEKFDNNVIDLIKYMFEFYVKKDD
jgi:hypothetical protein